MGIDLVALEYGTFLKVSAALPLRFGANLTSARGHWLAHHDRDWRSISLGIRYVRDRTYSALGQLAQLKEKLPAVDLDLPSDPGSMLGKQLVDRFIYAAFEEWQAALIYSKRVGELSFLGQASHAVLPTQAIIATMHVDSPMLGLVQLGRWGRPLCALSSNVVEDPRVHLSIREFFAAKYSSMARYWHGGRCMHKETEMGSFVQAAKAGYSLAVFCDAPGQNRPGRGLRLPFLGKPRVLAPIAYRLANRLNLPVVAMHGRRLTHAQYSIEFSEPCYPDSGSSWIEPIYAFWSEKIIEKPSAWWAADLLDSFDISY
jgi:hypothetical protein